MTTNPTQDPKDEEKHADEAHTSGVSHHSESLDHPLKRHFPAPSETRRYWTSEYVQSFVPRSDRKFQDAIAEEHNAVVRTEREHAEKLAGALSLLRDYQNGCPLPSYEKNWNHAMELADAALVDWEAK